MDTTKDALGRYYAAKEQFARDVIMGAVKSACQMHQHGGHWQIISLIEIGRPEHVRIGEFSWGLRMPQLKARLRWRHI